MIDPTQFYIAQIQKHTDSLKGINRQLSVSSILRLLVFVAGCIAIYYTFHDARLVTAFILVSLAMFVILVIRHNKLKYSRDLLLQLIGQNEVEIEVQKRVYQHLPTGQQYKSAVHDYSLDIDLFGKGSFFQYLNRTSLASGSDYLAALLVSNSIEDVAEKQEAIKELSAMTEWRQRFSAIASLVKTEVPSSVVSDWLQDYNRFMPNWVKSLSIGFSIVSILLFLIYYFGYISGYWLAGWFFLGLAISGRYLKKVNELASETSKIQSTFEQFHKLLLEIEIQTFNSTFLRDKRATVIKGKSKSSEVLRNFSRRLDALEQRSIMIFGILLNGFFLRDLYQCYYIEKWIENNKSQVPLWFDAITFFDAYNSMGNFAFNHPKYIFPTLNYSGETVLKVSGAGHPLLKEETMVRNDFHINSEEFFIITGANMAGKSTFLRTVSLQIVMGNVGLPVCAIDSEYRPIKLITSMRTTDSLTDDESYFFSELKRLKFIVDKIKTDEYFIILDEILKGTNSTDKAMGSRKFVEKLVASNSTGIIATHDLSLCDISKELKEVRNHYFDAQIIDDELFFDYKFKSGVCQNMNASFLLKKMEIVD